MYLSAGDVRFYAADFLCAVVFLSFEMTEEEFRTETDPPTVFSEGLKELITESLRELLHEEPTLLRDGHPTTDATEGTENAGLESKLISGPWDYWFLFLLLVRRLAAASRSHVHGHETKWAERMGWVPVDGRGPFGLMAMAAFSYFMSG